MVRSKKAFWCLGVLCFGFTLAFGQNKLMLAKPSRSRFTVTDRVWPANHGQADVCLWADDKIAAITFKIDDNCGSDWDFWTSMCAKYDFKQTWDVITMHPNQIGTPDYNAFFGSWSDFRHLHDLGHSIESHSVHHDMEDTVYTHYDYELRQSQQDIKDSIGGGYVPLLYSMPGHNGAPFDLVQKYYIGQIGVNGGTNHADAIDYNNLMALGYNSPFDPGLFLDPQRNSWPASYRGLGLFACDCIAGFPGLFSFVEDSVLKPMQNYRELLWTTTVEEACKYGQERDTKTLTVISVTDSLIQFDLTDSMIDSRFDYPLTVKVRVDNDWHTASAVQNGDALQAELVTQAGNQYVLVQAVPDRGTVSLHRGGTTGMYTAMTGTKAPGRLVGCRVYDMHGRLRHVARTHYTGRSNGPARQGLPVPNGLYLMQAEDGDLLRRVLVIH